MFRIVIPLIGIALLVWGFKKYRKHRAFIKASSEIEEVTDALEVAKINKALQQTKDKLNDK